MQLPLEITFRHMEPSEPMEARIREAAAKLDRFYDHIMSCRVVVEAPHHHHHQGNLYHVRVDVTVPDEELVASREPPPHHAHEDAYVAIRDAFNAVTRQLEEYARKRQRHVKRHQAPLNGRVYELDLDGGYGRIETGDGRDFYFHRNALEETGFDALQIGAQVGFYPAEGDEGPQASSVWLAGHHFVSS